MGGGEETVFNATPQKKKEKRKKKKKSKKKEKAQTRMTASILKEDPNTQKV